MIEPVRVEGLNFGYPGVPLFREFSFLTRAARTVIRGPSGCGKTTLLKILAGIEPAGSKAVLQAPAPAFVVLQNDGLIPWLDGKKNIEFFGKRIWMEAVESSLYPLVKDFLGRRAYEMSFGQRRSLELIRALLSKRPLLLLDEPLNFLDRDRRADFLKFMGNEALCPSRIVMTSHYEDASALPGSCVLEFTGDPPFEHLEVISDG